MTVLNTYVRNIVLPECPDKGPKIVLVGYSLGAWVINEWLNREVNDEGGKDLWKHISAVELYGDVLWHRQGRPYLGAPEEDTYEGVLRHLNIPWLIGLDIKNDPYLNKPEGPDGELHGRWHSRCLKGDALCGEGYGVGYAPPSGYQIGAALKCGPGDSLCEHQRYSLNHPRKGDPVYTATCGDPQRVGKKSKGYGLTSCGAEFLNFKTFPDETTKPKIENYETFTEGEGDHVYIRLYYTGSPTGFGFVGVNGAGWAQAEIPFKNTPAPISSWIRVSPGRVDYPFNHLCSTEPKNKSDIEAWVYKDGFNPRESARERIHLECSAPKEVVTPFFPN